MDLRIGIFDENGETLDEVTIYQDGGDGDGTAQIVKYIRQNFMTECDECYDPYDDSDGPTCQTCLDWEVTGDT